MGSRPRLLSQQTLNVQRATPQWARIGSVAGAASDTTYTDAAGITWRCVQWTASNAGGLLLAVQGLVDVLVVGGGGGGANYSGRTAGGGAGGFWTGLTSLSAGTHAVVVGAGGPAGSINGNPGGVSSLGASLKIGGGGAGFVANTGSWQGHGGGGSSGGASVPDAASPAGGGAGGTVYGANYYDGRSSAITGTSVVYANARADSSAGVTGTGQGGGQNAAGGSGLVAIRVPA